MSNLVVDANGTIWAVEGQAEGITRLVRGWGALAERKFAIFGKDVLRAATDAECARYLESKS